MHVVLVYYLKKICMRPMAVVAAAEEEAAAADER